MNKPSASIEEFKSSKPIFIVIAAWSAILAASFYSYAPIDVRPETIPANEFSAARATSILKLLVGDAIPHPAGSEQNAVVRKRIVALLESYGYEVEIQTGSSFQLDEPKYEPRNDAELNNIIAILRSRNSKAVATETARNQTDRHAIMLVSHYDSVPMGPGASDDGVGTAALLEIARMLSEEQPPERDIVFLITDGEELGLHGATLFAEKNPLIRQIKVAINLEARGTTGPSMLFETSRNSLPLIKVFSQTGHRPFASSLFYEIYRMMRNDTDFTVLKANGIHGFNFAFVGNPVFYHTPNDNYENSDPRSLQHHGSNATGLIRALLNSEMMDKLPSIEETASDESRKNEAVFFDLFGRVIVWWPWTWSFWLTLAAIPPFAVLALKLNSDMYLNSDITAKEPKAGSRLVNLASTFLFHLFALGVCSILIFVVGYFLQSTIRQDDRLSRSWPTHPFPLMLGFWLACMAIVGAVTLVLDRWLKATGSWLAFAFTWIFSAWAATNWVNGASYLFIVPSLTSVLFATVFFRSSARSSSAKAKSKSANASIATISVFTALVVGVIWLPMERMFYDGVGFKLPYIMLFRIAAVCSTLPAVLAIASTQVKFIFTMLMTIAAVVALVTAVAINVA